MTCRLFVASLLACTLSALGAAPAAAQDLTRVCVSWGGPEDGTETVVYHPDGTAEVERASWLDEPERGVRRWTGTAPEGVFEALSNNLPARLSALGPEPSAESCDAGNWLWVIEAQLADGTVLRGEGACYDGPVEALYRDVIDWTQLLRVDHSGGDGEVRQPATAADHAVCQGRN